VLPVVICIDVEPDPRVFDPADPPPWLGFERLLEHLPELRDRLSDASGRPATFTWFLRMDPQIALTWGSASWAAERYAKELAELTAAGDELALHTHPWRRDEGSAEWIAEFADPAWAEHCTCVGVDSFRQAFGRGPEAHRGGDHFLSGAMLAPLENAGVRVDLTVEPNATSEAQPPKGERGHGELPDYSGVPSAPYRSSPERFPLPAPVNPTGPLLFPLTTAPGKWPPLRRKPLKLATRGVIFVPSLRVALARRPAAIAFAIRTHAIQRPAWSKIERNLIHLAGRHGVALITARAAADLLDGRPDQPASSPPPSSAGSARGPSGYIASS
jgi:hypothetical protein